MQYKASGDKLLVKGNSTYEQGVDTDEIYRPYCHAGSL